MTTPRWHLFEVTGIELEYMIVDALDFRVRPICDALMQDITGAPVNDVEDAPVGWSNELARHILEFKCLQPARDLSTLPALFRAQIDRANKALEKHGARLMGSGCHPFMDPLRETELWPHELNEIYNSFNRIFDCRGHGWSNLQSMHINLPFADDEEFALLHSAIRLLLPLLPALSASTPIIGAQLTGLMDNRLHYYARNCVRVPLCTGLVVPEPSHSEAHYREAILQPLYEQIAPLDPEGLLQEEWLNARGAIARFERNAIEIRVLDVQETAEADLQLAQLIVATLRYLIETQRCGQQWDAQFATASLAAILQQTIRDGEQAVISDVAYCRWLEVAPGSSATAIWQALAQRVALSDLMFPRATLARRMSDCAASRHHDWVSLCRQMCDCLHTGSVFKG